MLRQPVSSWVLILGWTPSLYRGTIIQVKKRMEELRKKGLSLNIDWTPGHADIAGNEIADKLAKSAAEEAETMEHENRVVTATYIKTVETVSCEKKWRRRWNLTNSGRGLFEYRKEVCQKGSKLIKPKHLRVISKLRTGYCLNEYFHKIVIEKPYCKCGEVESREHYILECAELEDITRTTETETFTKSRHKHAVNVLVLGNEPERRTI